MHNAIAQEMVTVMNHQAASATRLANNVEHLEDALPLLKRQAVALEQIAKVLERLDTRFELCVEPESFKHPDETGTVFKVRRYK